MGVRAPAQYELYCWIQYLLLKQVCVYAHTEPLGQHAGISAFFKMCFSSQTSSVSSERWLHFTHIRGGRSGHLIWNHKQTHPERNSSNVTSELRCLKKEKKEKKSRAASFFGGLFYSFGCFLFQSKHAHKRAGGGRLGRLFALMIRNY